MGFEPLPYYFIFSFYADFSSESSGEGRIACSQCHYKKESNTMNAEEEEMKQKVDLLKFLVTESSIIIFIKFLHPTRDLEFYF